MIKSMRLLLLIGLLTPLTFAQSKDAKVPPQDDPVLQAMRSELERSKTGFSGGGFWCAPHRFSGPFPISSSCGARGRLQTR